MSAIPTLRFLFATQLPKRRIPQEASERSQCRLDLSARISLAGYASLEALLVAKRHASLPPSPPLFPLPFLLPTSAGADAVSAVTALTASASRAHRPPGRGTAIENRD